MNDDAFQVSLAQSEGRSASAQRKIPWRAPKALSDPKARFPGFHQRKIHYKAGQVVKPGYMPLPSDLMMHESVPTKLSDDTTLYSDVFLPEAFKNLDDDYAMDNRVPAIIAWSPYGKQVGTQILSDYPFHCGVPPETVSSLQKWEGPDPAFWCSQNYAIVNVDMRGTFTSQGDGHLLGHQEAKDGAEFVTWVSKQKWCNGKVGMAGNSYLAVSQWKIASLRPKGLAALAPWEGMLDIYKNVVCHGGIPDTGPLDLMTSPFAGQGKMEDLVGAANGAGSECLYDEYWEDKRSVVERINCPVYAVASWTSIFHTNGTLKAFRLLHEKVPKWLRVHNTQEWPDFYEHRNVLDLKRFFDRYLKDLPSDWEATPPIRLSVLNFGMNSQEDTIERAESSFPLTRTRYTKHFLTVNKSLSLTPPTSPSKLSYNSQTGNLIFQYTIPHDMETTGYPMAHLNLSCTSPTHTPTSESETETEIDIFVQIELLSSTHWRQGTLVIRPKSGPQYRLLKLMHDWNIGMSRLGLLYHFGSDGRLRGSFAHERDETSTDFEPSYSFRERRLIKTGEVVGLDVPMRAYGLFWRRGDVLRFTVAGRPVIPHALPGVKGPRIENRGVHVLLVGGRGGDSSYLVLPVV